jgi:GNAT superfamily N-acetyltransferase
VSDIAASAHPTSWRIVEVPVPSSLDAPDAWAVHGTVHVGDAIDREIHGHTDLALDAGTTLTSMTSTEYKRVVRWVAVVGDRTTPRPEDVVGRGMVSLPQKGNTHLAVVYVGVHPDHRGRGIGTALWEIGERAARAAGRTVLMSDSSHSPEPPPGPGTIESPTGSGRVPADAAGVRFALSRGFELEQVVRHSVLDLPVAPQRLTAFRERAQAVAGDDYRTLTWQDEVPDGWLDQFAVLETRMSTDAPNGGLKIEEDPWDAERVRATSQEVHDRGHGYLITAVEHVPTSSLAGFTMVAYPLVRPEVVFQEDTLVLREHRGHSLGLLVKTVNLQELARVRPSSRRVHTWNAQENSYMLAINMALGFAASSVDAEWQRKLT